jgi:hypothetical protein
MARPKPIVLLEHTDNKSYRSEQVLKAEAIYAVFFDGEPINLRSLNSLVNFPGPKYKKVSFSNPGHAINLAQRLNKLFKSDKFEVYVLTQGEKIDLDEFDE